MLGGVGVERRLIEREARVGRSLREFALAITLRRYEGSNREQDVELLAHESIERSCVVIAEWICGARCIESKDIRP
jgi:hypothetical protein